MEEINWTRWFMYLIVGVPALAWLLFTRDNVLRVLAVLGILMFAEGIFAWRRHFFGVGVGPSVAFVYVALVGLYLQRGRFPALGAQGFLWALFLFAALIGLMLGSFGTGLLLFNVKSFQEYFLEGALFFLVGVMAFDRDEDVIRFLYRFVVVIGGGVAAFHMIFIVTGWQPAHLEHAAMRKGYDLFVGGIFSNPNSQADFWVMTLPMTLLFFLRGGFRGARRLLLAGLLMVMTVSLLLSAARGGILFTIVMLGAAFLLSGEGLGRTGLIALIGALTVGIAVLVGVYALPELFAAMFEQLETEGLETSRFRTWAQFLRMLFDHPFGVGLHPENILRVGAQYGTRMAGAHNIYLTLAVMTGFLGIFAFLGLVGSVLLRIWRALRESQDPQTRQAAMYLFLAVGGFLLGGTVEPIYTSGYTLHQLFWLLVGLSLATSQRALAVAHEARLGADSETALQPHVPLTVQRTDHV